MLNKDYNFIAYGGNMYEEDKKAYKEAIKLYVPEYRGDYLEVFSTMNKTQIEGFLNAYFETSTLKLVSYTKEACYYTANSISDVIGDDWTFYCLIEPTQWLDSYISSIVETLANDIKVATNAEYVKDISPEERHVLLTVDALSTVMLTFAGLLRSIRVNTKLTTEMVHHYVKLTQLVSTAMSTAMLESSEEDQNNSQSSNLNPFNH